MRKMLPEGAVRQKMKADGIAEGDINKYFESDNAYQASECKWKCLVNQVDILSSLYYYLSVDASPPQNSSVGGGLLAGIQGISFIEKLYI